LTVRQYQSRWLDMLEYVTGAPLGFRLALLPPELRFLSGIPPEVAPIGASLLDVAYPVLGRSFVAPPSPCDDCEEGADAIVFGIKLQPIMAVADGVVTAVDDGDAVTGEVSVTISDAMGRTYTYRGFNDDNPGTADGAAPRHLRLTSLSKVGTVVRAGQILGFMGDTDPMPANEHRGVVAGDAIWPHLRLTIREADGTRVDADVLVSSSQGRRACHVAIGPWSVPEDPDLADVDVDDALITPPQGCQWAPDRAFGPGAAGGDANTWEDEIEVDAEFWVTGSLAGTPAALPVVVGG
jgi:hypothetical protein